MGSPMKIKQQGLVYSGPAGSGTQSATFPMVCVTDTGRWWCAFRASPAKIPNVEQSTLLTFSDDEGKTWSKPVAPFTPPEVDGKPGLFRIAGLCDLGEGKLFAAINWADYSDPELAYFNEDTEGLLDTRIFVSESEDHGESWSALRLVNTTPFNVPTPMTGPPLRLPSGDLVCPYELNKDYEDQKPWHHLSVLQFSEDKGKSWTRLSVPIEDPDNQIFYWDQRLSFLPDGRLFDVFWTFDRKTSDYLNIHATFSADEGRTWTPLLDTKVPGQPGPVFGLSNKSLAMPVVDRSGAPKITLRQSDDGGITWPEEKTLVIYEAKTSSQTVEKSSMQDAWAEMYDFSVGLPHAAPLPDGGAVVAYYAGDNTDQTAIRFAVID